MLNGASRRPRKIFTRRGVLTAKPTKIMNCWIIKEGIRKLRRLTGRSIPVDFNRLMRSTVHGRAINNTRSIFARLKKICFTLKSWLESFASLRDQLFRFQPDRAAWIDWWHWGGRHVRQGVEVWRLLRGGKKSFLLTDRFWSDCSKGVLWWTGWIVVNECGGQCSTCLIALLGRPTPLSLVPFLDILELRTEW